MKSFEAPFIYFFNFQNRFEKFYNIFSQIDIVLSIEGWVLDDYTVLTSVSFLVPQSIIDVVAEIVYISNLINNYELIVLISKYFFKRVTNKRN